MFAPTQITHWYRIRIMTPTRTLMITSALATLLASPSLADLTAEQVLADQLRQMESYGLKASVTSQSRSGDTLTVDALSATADVPDGKFSMTVGGAFFRELDDGTVEITYPADIPLSISGTSPEGEDFEVSMSMSQSNTRTVVSGTPENLRYVFASDSFAVNNLKFLAPQEATDIDMNIDMTMTGLTGDMALAGATLRDYTANFSFETLSGTFSGMPEGEEGEISVEFEGSDIAANYTGRMAPQELMGSLAASIQAGNRTDGTATHGPLTYSFKGSSEEGTFEGAAAIASGSFDFKMDEGGLDYGGVSRDMTFSIGGSAIPLPPMTFKMAESGGRFAMPVVPSEDEQGFALRMSLVGLELDQMLWGMFDPAGQLPRDPATLVVDLDGDVVLSEDIFDPQFAEQMAGAPGQINGLNINQILLNLAGAELTGDGAFSFDNSSDIPAPSGTVNLVLTGGNGLLDTLVGMGLLPEEQAMGARMMMGLFARPGEGADTLVSTIEVNEDGSVLANGQRIR